MENREKKSYLLLTASVLLTLICFGLCVYFTVRELFGELIIQGLIMILAWLPCVGLVILLILVYCYGWYCIKNKPKETKKMIKSTWIFSILISGYMVALSLVFTFADFANFGIYLVVSILSALNMVFLILWSKKIKQRSEEE